MIRAALALYEATGDHAYLERALAWQGTLDRHYANPDNGGYFLTADDARDLVVRPNATTDDATPNANVLAAQNLIRLAVFTARMPGATNATACSTESWRAPATIRLAIWPCSMRSICACAPPRS